MIGLTSEITEEVSFGRRDHHLYFCPQMKEVYDKVPCLRAQVVFEPTFSDCESGAVATMLTQPHVQEESSAISLGSVSCCAVQNQLEERKFKLKMVQSTSSWIQMLM